MQRIRQFPVQTPIGPDNAAIGSKTAALTRLVTSSVVVLAVLGLSACESLLRQPAETAAPAAQGPGAAGDPHATRIADLLLEAGDAFDDDRLTTPVDDSAYLIYLQILSLDPENVAAERGIADIVERYLEWAISNAGEFNLRKATDYLRRAASVDPGHPNIAAVSAMVEERRRAHTVFHSLPRDALRSRNAAAVDTLRDIGNQISATGASAVIVARSDAEGRWIYQQLNATAEARVRAELRFGETPGVRLIYPSPD